MRVIAAFLLFFWAWDSATWQFAASLSSFLLLYPTLPHSVVSQAVLVNQNSKSLAGFAGCLLEHTTEKSVEYTFPSVHFFIDDPVS